MNWIDNLLKPDEYYTDLSQIDFTRYKAQGFRLIMLDIDNTLSPHGSLNADNFAHQAVDRILAAGLLCWLISNGPTRRIQKYAASLDLPSVPLAYKPSIRGLRLACRLTSTKPCQAILIGDQMLTDIISAHRAGCRAVLVNPLGSAETWNVRVKRRVEKYLRSRYKMI
jgi:HAD superfamily phosphatase (TIGR01668 family)